MTQAEILAAARQMATAGLPFIFATTDANGAPHARWMGGLVLDEPFTVCMVSRPDTRKMEQIRGNPQGQIVFHSPDYMKVATVNGTCQISDDPEAKQRLWAALPQMARLFSGPEDPNLGVVVFGAQHIELLDVTQLPPQTEVADL